MASAEALAQSRLFFALWPEPAARQRIGSLRDRFHREYGGRPVATPSLHITLAFLGDTLDTLIPALDALAREVDAMSFNLLLAFAGAWNKGVFWLAPREAPAELGDLVTKLHAKLRGAGIRFANQPFAPHLTLMRNAQYAGPLIAVDPIELRMEDFVLVHTVFAGPGARHEVIGRFPLRSPLLQSGS
jgi:2'-5' RNA ligase